MVEKSTHLRLTPAEALALTDAIVFGLKRLEAVHPNVDLDALHHRIHKARVEALPQGR